MARPSRAAALLAAGLLLGGPGPVAPPPQREPSPPATSGRSPRLEEAVARALAWLAGPDAHLPRDGSYLLGDAENPAPIAVTALATLAFLAHGETEDRGPYGRIVAAGVGYLLDHQVAEERRPDGSERVDHGYFWTANDQLSRTHGHGYATLCLAQALGMAGCRRDSLFTEEQLRAALVRAVRFIERIQGPSGGWYYYPYRDPESHEGSVTITLVQALRAARNAGIRVDSDVIRRADDYVRRSQLPDGSFRYQLGSDRSSTALTAAAIATLNMVGRYDDPVLERGLARLLQELPLQRSRLRHLGEDGVPFPCYERLYVAQALWQGRTLRHWHEWFPEELALLLRAQDSRGSWRSRKYGAVYATAVNCLVLQMPFAYLPIFQR